VGVGSDFGRGHQVDFVLGRFPEEDLVRVEAAVEQACDAVKCFATQGIDRTMNLYNKKGNAHGETKNDNQQ
jgi:PTH1 family peptidyl-tRNA hydrolase